MAMYNTKLNYNGEPCTWRHVSTVRGQALGNLPQKCGKAPSAEPTIYQGGRYCTFPHAIELLNKKYADVFTILRSYPELENYLSPFVDAWESDAQEQLQGQIASAKIPLSRMISPALYWVMTGDDFSLDINNPKEPKILVVGNNPDRQNIYSAALGLYNSRIVKLINKKGQLKSSVIIDELPTIYFRGLDNLIATARSNKVAVLLGFSAINAIIILHFLMVGTTFSSLWTSWVCPFSGSCPVLFSVSLSAWRWVSVVPVSAALWSVWLLHRSFLQN
jgi:hypothetical protein